MTNIEKLQAAVEHERKFARDYLRCFREGRYARQPEKIHVIRLRLHARRIADALGALYRAHAQASAGLCWTDGEWHAREVQAMGRR